MGEEKFALAIKDAPLIAKLHGEIWQVFSYPIIKQPDTTDEVTVVTGNGGPVIELSKRDGRVVDIYFAK
jgi:hypothetical protein